jgi:hypothetical protein
LRKELIGIFLVATIREGIMKKLEWEKIKGEVFRITPTRFYREI